MNPISPPEVSHLIPMAPDVYYPEVHRALAWATMVPVEYRVTRQREFEGPVGSVD